MTTLDDLRRQANEARVSAARAWRLAGSWGISSEDFVARLVPYVAELEKQAEALEAQGRATDLSLPPLLPVVMHSQQRVPQQSNSASDKSDIEPKKPPRPD